MTNHGYLDVQVRSANFNEAYIAKISKKLCYTYFFWNLHSEELK